jgi:dCTP deaminase
MILRSEKIAEALELADNPEKKDPLVIVPLPDPEKLKEEGSASVDLRLGTWFVSLRTPRMPALEIDSGSDDDLADDPAFQLTETHYVRFGDTYYLHPHSFVLGVTLEWLRIPKNLFGYVIGKSSLGRRGLVIATATGVHPGFTGCLTLELTNLGEIPIAIKPGMLVCQLCLHSAADPVGDLETGDRSQFNGSRRPALGRYKLDKLASALARAGK